jgi:hypothetical protein
VPKIATSFAELKIAPREIIHARNHCTRSKLRANQSGGKPPHSKMICGQSACVAYAHWFATPRAAMLYHALRHFRILLLR